MKSKQLTLITLCCYIFFGLYLSSCTEKPHQTNVDTSAIMKLKFPDHVNSIDEIYDTAVLSKIDYNEKTRVLGCFPFMNQDALNYGCIDIYSNSDQALSDFIVPFSVSANCSKLDGKDNLCAVSLGERNKDEFGFHEGTRYGRRIFIKKSNVIIKLHEYASEPSNLQKVIDALAENMRKRLGQNQK